ncbi:MAG: HNH endonuclease [Phycisphaerales bacterium]
MSSRLEPSAYPSPSSEDGARCLSASHLFARRRLALESVGNGSAEDEAATWPGATYPARQDAATTTAPRAADGNGRTAPSSRTPPSLASMARRKRPAPSARSCPRVDCPLLITPPSDRCPAGHGPAGGWEPDVSRGTPAQRGYGAAWRKVRARIIRRDGGRCRQCGSARPPLTVDHRRPRWAGGGEDDDNLVTLCRRCHARKTAAEAAEVRRLRRGGG